MIALIDGDSIPFAVGWHLRELEVENNEEQGIEATKLFMEGLLNGSRCDAYIGFLGASRDSTKRKMLYPEYKATRKEAEREDHYKEWRCFIKKVLREEYGFFHEIRDGLEADDLVSMTANRCRDFGEEYIVCGIDKDLLQIPGAHYNFKAMAQSHRSQEACNNWLFYQILVGDRGDNIPGLKGIGPIKAASLLKPSKRLDITVIQAYIDKYGLEEGLEQFNLMYQLIKLETNWKDNLPDVVPIDYTPDFML